MTLDEPVTGPAGQKPPVAAAVTPAPQPAEAPAAAVPTAVAPREDFENLLRSSFEAFHRGDYETAMLGYERVLGSADDPRDQVRALISLAMIRLLPSSKMRDAEAAKIVMDELDRRIRLHDLQYEFFGAIELLTLLEGRDRETGELRAANARLRKSLAAKEELVRQLRALSVEGG